MRQHKLYCCGDSQRAYEDYYAQQCGGGSMPYFRGRRFQRGHGIGDILGGLMRRFVLPFIKTQGKKLAQTALQTGMQVAGDVVGGRSFKESVGEHVPKAIKRTAGELIGQSIPDNRASKTPVAKKKRPKRRNKRDIFT